MPRTPSNSKSTTSRRTRHAQLHVVSEGEGPAHKPKVLYRDEQWGDRIQQARDALRAANTEPSFFRKGDVLTQVIHQPRLGGSALVTRELTAVALRGELARRVDWVDSAGQPCAPERDLAADMVATPDPRLPLLDRVTTSPVFSPDGRLIIRSGYDAQSGILYSPDEDLRLPPVPERPSARQIKQAIDLLMSDLLRDFPFIGAASRATAVALLLAHSTRSMISGPTPLYAISSPVPGSGKNLLSDVAALLCTGRSCASVPITFGDRFGEQEASRTLTALLLEGPEFALLDNLGDTVNSGVLAALLTSTEWRGRVLGRSEARALPNRTIWVATGNQLRFSQEISRRTVLIRLDAGTEHPWQRTGFAHPDLRRWVRENRGKLLAAVLTLTQAWLSQGRPKGKVTRGSFEEWSETLGGILAVAGIDGLLQDEPEHSIIDVEGDELRDLIEYWHRAHADRWVTASELLAVLRANGVPLRAISGDSERAQLSGLGRYLSEVEGRVALGLQINAASDSHAKARRYRLRRAS